jgi:tetratricopeptide (TPR) repeat protein
VGLSELSPVKAAVDRDGQLVPAMEYYALGASSESIRALWLRLPEHPGLIAAISSSNVPRESIVLRYASLTGKYWFAAEVARDLASFGAQLADVYRSICAVVDDAELGRLLEPLAMIDVLKQLRVGFRPIDRWTSRMAPEVERTWPRCDQRAIVRMIGEVVSDFIYSCRDRSLWAVLDRCREDKPSKRYQTVDEVYRAFAILVPDYQRTTADDFAAWRRIEEGMGWMELGYSKRALDQVEPFREHARFGKLARICHALSRKAYDEHLASLPKLVWSTAEPVVLRLESTGDFEEALARLDKVIVDATNQLVIDVARARCHLGLGQVRRAIELARRAIRSDPAGTEPRNLLVRALMSCKRHEEALVEIDALLARIPGDAAQHYTRGKVLLALSRLPEARDAFDQACKLAPMMLEAMLLRREVDRCMAGGRREVGAQGPITFDIPASLSELRDVLIGGRTSDAISALSQPRFLDDLDAQLVLARILVFDRQLESALQIYDRIAQLADPHRHAALVAKAGVLLSLGHRDSALALFDLVCSEKPNDVDASEGRARALEQAGRTGEAAAEYRRFISLATSRSDVRVRAAQLWLDALE